MMGGFTDAPVEWIDLFTTSFNLLDASDNIMD